MDSRLDVEIARDPAERGLARMPGRRRPEPQTVDDDPLRLAVACGLEGWPRRSVEAVGPTEDRGAHEGRREPRAVPIPGALTEQRRMAAGRGQGVGEARVWSVAVDGRPARAVSAVLWYAPPSPGRETAGGWRVTGTAGGLAPASGASVTMRTHGRSLSGTGDVAVADGTDGEAEFEIVNSPGRERLEELPLTPREEIRERQLAGAGQFEFEVTPKGAWIARCVDSNAGGVPACVSSEPSRTIDDAAAELVARLVAPPDASAARGD